MLLTLLFAIRLGLIVLASAALDPSAPPVAPDSNGSSSASEWDRNGFAPILWGKCPQLAPTEEERKMSARISKKCHEVTGPIVNTDNEVLERFINKFAECRYNMTNLFNADGTFKYDHSIEWIEKRGLDAPIKAEMLEIQKLCKREALEQSPPVIEQAQSYESCINFQVLALCNITTVIPKLKEASTN